LKVKPVLQTLAPNESYRASEPVYGEDRPQGINLRHYVDVLKRRFFYFLLPFGLISILGVYVAAILKPTYLSEGKILVEAQVIAPDFVRPVGTATASERIQLIQQRVFTRERILSIANKFGLFSGRSDTLELMRKNIQIKPADADGQSRQGTPTIAFTVGFEYENPDIALRVADELVTLIVDEDARSRTSRATEAVKILTGETKDIEGKLEAAQVRILEIARQPRDSLTEMTDRQKLQMTAYSALKSELIQKMSIYSESHPAVTALKKRVAAMEKSMAEQPPAEVRSTQPDDIEAAKRYREALEKQLADANSKLAAARLSEKLDRDQQSERIQVVESPARPQKPEKTGRLKIVGLAFAAAAMFGVGAVLAAELLNGSIRHRQQLSGVVTSSLIVSIPYIETSGDILRRRSRAVIAAVSVVILLAILGGLMVAIVLGLPVDFSSLRSALTGLR
jgi:capsule polysaccharide export protein KpsE/RkpR